MSREAEMMSNYPDSRNMLGGFVLGAAVGAGLAILFAPAAGDVTRRKLGETAQKIRNGARERGDEIRSGVGDMAHNLGSAINEGRETFTREMNKGTEVRPKTDIRTT